MTGGGRALAGLLLAACLAAGLAFAVARHLGLAGLDARLDQSLILTRRSVESEIGRFRYLPEVAGRDARVLAALAAPQDGGAVLAANRYLAGVAEVSGASHLYLLDTWGRTIAASNWDTPDSFVGESYAFRPYFTDAMATGQGRFYAIGVTTGQPGYFLSTRIGAGAASGVMVVKVDLSPLQAAWTSAGAATAIADADGVVFLSAESAWLYRPLAPLDAATVARITAARTYDGVDLASRPPLGVAGPVSSLADGARGALRAREVRVAPDDWRLIAAAPVAPVHAAAAAWALGAALAAALATGVELLRRQRAQILRLRLRQGELLERKVAERTAALGREIEARRQTEASLRAAQEGLVHSEKMAALGRMSAAIVHEVSQPLAAMEATLAAAQIGLPPGAEATGARIETARGLIRRMQRTIKHLKSFARKDSGALDVIDAAAVAESAVELVQPRARALGLAPVLDRPPGPVAVRAGAVRLEQVLVNLLLNALDAVEGRAGGAVRLGIAQTADGVVLAVRDNGPGIPAEDLARVTEPFYSTKTGEGLGLGLSISQAIVTEFGGRLDIESAPDEGTVVRVTLPASRAAEAAQ